MEELIIGFAKDIVNENLFLSYVFFFASQSLQILFPPYPGDMILIIEGYLSELAHLNIFFVIINAVLATSLASFILYEVGRKKNKKILQSKIIRLLFDTDKVEKLRKLFDKYGPFVIFFSKFIPGIFSITVITAGIFRVPKKKAVTSIISITALHHIVLILFGKIVGENWDIIFHKLDTYNRYLFIIILGAFIVYVFMHLLKRRLLK